MELYHDSENNSKLSHQPYFSVVVTTYNRAKILTRALDSLISQSETDWEAIIIDDESTDDTYLQILPYISSHRNMRYIRKVHSGEALSKNAGINASMGRFITFLDSDDEYHPVHLESRKAVLIQDSSIKFLHGGAKILGNPFVPDRFDYKKVINLAECVIGGTFVVERSVMFQLEGFRRIILGTDADLFDRAKKAGINIGHTKIPTYIYHHENEDSITNMMIKSKAIAGRAYSNLNQ